jgi:membrane protease YdiL (CAAX protease family)
MKVDPDVAADPKVDPRRQIILYLSIAFPMAMAVPLLLPKTSNGAPLLSIPIPLIATAIAIALTVPRGRRRAAWGEMRLGRLGFKGWPVAVLLPIAIAVISYASAALLGVARFPNLPQSLEIGFDAVLTLLIFTIVFMGEEIGWRGFLLPRFAQLTSFRNAALATGLAHGLFHLPLYLIGSSYMPDGSRWIVVPIAMVVFIFAGVVYAWLLRLSGSVWPVSLAHNSFNLAFETIGPAAVATSPAALAYVAGETGLVTLALVILLAGWLIWRSPIFTQANPSGA